MEIENAASNFLMFNRVYLIVLKVNVNLLKPSIQASNRFCCNPNHSLLHKPNSIFSLFHNLVRSIFQAVGKLVNLELVLTIERTSVSP